jgi:hypothetical protein
MLDSNTIKVIKFNIKEKDKEKLSNSLSGIDDNIKIEFFNILFYCCQSSKVKKKLEYSEKVIKELIDINYIIALHKKVDKITETIDLNVEEKILPTEIHALKTLKDSVKEDA